VCQVPAYVAHANGYFADEGVAASIAIEPTAWMVPAKLARGESQFAVMPWTRAAAGIEQVPLVVVCGSGHEEAAIVVRHGIDVADVRRASIPQRGGMKDLTAMGLIESLGWKDVEIRRQPSGDGAIISFFGRGCDAASMVEPYATMMEQLGVGRVVKRTGDVWPGAPGCSLTTTRQLVGEDPGLVGAVVGAFVRGAQYAREEAGVAAEVAAGYIGVAEQFIEEALKHHPPDVDAVRNTAAIDQILSLMVSLGYIETSAPDFTDLSFLDRVAQAV
jgi:ABC-type nitrate/sulfonate/bicarbonate transport system substrate-binding protein